MTYSLNHNFFSELTEKSMYWAGFLAADGNVAKDKPRITLALKSSDIDHIEKFKTDLNFAGPIKNFSIKDNRENFKTGLYHKSQIRFTSKQIANNLQSNFNITPNKSKTLKFPNHIKDHPLINHFIRGLIDGDGGIYYRFVQGRNENVCNVFLCGTEDIVKSVQNILNLNLKVTGTYSVTNNGLSRLIYRSLGSNQSIINYTYNGATTYLERKQKVADKILSLKPRKSMPAPTHAIQPILLGA